MFPVPAVVSVKGFDEDSVASVGTTQDETADPHPSENGVANNSPHPFQGGGYMLAASFWPKVNRCNISMNVTSRLSFLLLQWFLTGGGGATLMPIWLFRIES